jgi:hypothetical protein
MDLDQQRTAYQQIANKARRAGILRYDAHGVMIIVQPDPAKAPPKAEPAPAAAPSPGN